MNLRLKYDATPENAAALADEIVQSAKRVDGIALDYSEESVEKVDGIIESFRREKVPLESIAETLFCAGCYVGEVFVRSGRGGARPHGVSPLIAMGVASDSRARQRDAPYS